METVAVLVQRIGPYHHARFRAFAAKSARRMAVVEFRTEDTQYAWSEVREAGGYDPIRTHSRGELCEALDRARPRVLVCVGYSDPEVHQGAVWALSRGVPLVVCSDSTYIDEPRSLIKEAFKRRIIDGFEAALVAGSRARAYLGGLGMSADRMFQPWDVVDNAAFIRGAELARADMWAVRARLGLPEGYFLCVARFLAKKNLFCLVEAYRRYAARLKNEAWPLVLSGAGPLDAELRERVAEAGIKEKVHFAGFLQYPDLPACYGLAGAFVLPSSSDQWGLVVNEAMAAGLPVLVSSRCGCAPELVSEGQNGFTFDPENTAGLAACLERIADLTPGQREAMGRRSREIVAAFTPDAFADGLESAIDRSIVRRRRTLPHLSRLHLSILAMRKGPARR